MNYDNVLHIWSESNLTLSGDCLWKAKLLFGLRESKSKQEIEYMFTSGETLTISQE